MKIRKRFVALISKRLLFSSERLSHHYRIQHSRDRVCGDEEMKRRKNVLGKLMASETLNNIAIQSLKRQEQVRFEVCLLCKLNNFLLEIEA